MEVHLVNPNHQLVRGTIKNENWDLLLAFSNLAVTIDSGRAEIMAAKGPVVFSIFGFIID